MSESNPYQSPGAPSVGSRIEVEPSRVSRVPLLVALIASVVSTVLFFFAVTMFFIYPAMNIVAVAGLLVASGARRNSSHAPSFQRRLNLVCYALTFILVVIPWVQMFANIELAAYGWVAWWFERAIQGIL